MDIYVSDLNFKRQTILDSYESLIWTERYAQAGDVTLKLADTPQNRLAIQEDMFLEIPSSREVMQVETRLAEKGMLTITGPSIAEFFKNRAVKKSWDNQFGSVSFLTERGKVASWLVQAYAMGLGPDFVDSTINDRETIPYLVIGEEDDSDPETIIYTADHGDLYSAIKAGSDLFGRGFSLYLNRISDTEYELVFSTYLGKDRTSRQSLNEIVRFQPALDSLTDVRELRSISGYRNVAYAFAPNIVSTDPYIGYAYATPEAETAVGFARRTLLVQATDISDGDVDLTTTDGQTAFLNLLNQRARNGLANNNYVRMVDGEIVPQDMFKYGVDYNLGDIVELSTDGGESSYAQITEYIYSVDKTGHKQYPTLSVVDE